MKLTLTDLSFERHFRPLFEEVYCQLVSGDCLQMMGANGSGKSTLLKIIAGLLTPNSGSVMLNDRPVGNCSDQIHYLGHKNGVKLTLTVYENLQLLCALQHQRPEQDELVKVAQMLNLADHLHHFAADLSAGQCRRLSFARLLLTEAPVWILDEPMTSLDCEGQALLVKLCQQQLAKNGIILIATHQPLPLENIKIINLDEKAPHNITITESDTACSSLALGNITMDFNNTALPRPQKNPLPTDKALRAFTPAHSPRTAAPFFSLGTTIFFEVKTIFRRAFSWLTSLLFFIMVVCLFPIAIGPAPDTLQALAPGLIWATALLAIVISMEQLFRADEQEGSLVLLPFNRMPLSHWAACKIFSHWLAHCAPLILIGPLLGFLLNLAPKQEIALMITLLFGTPVLGLLGAIGAALVTGIRSHGLLLPILIMPLYVPVLIFGTGAVLAAGFGQPMTGHFALLAALLLSSLAFAPFITAIALRSGVGQ